MTINGAGTESMQPVSAGRQLLVIIGALLSAGAALANSNLTTTGVAPLTAVVVEGSSVYAAPALFATYRAELGRPAGRDAARGIAGAVAGLYERDGYVRPEVTLDGSLAASGVLRLRVHEAQVSRVLIEGGSGRRREALEDIGARLERARPLRRDDVPAALRAMRAIAGVSVTANTRRDADVRNAFELLVRADFSAVDGVVRVNNRGTDQVGPAFLLGQLFFNDVLGRNDRVGLIYAAATDVEEYLGGGLYLDLAASDAGTRLTTLLFSSTSAPDEAPFDHDLEYRRDRATLRLTHPLRQDGAVSLSVAGALDADDLIIDYQGVAIREERLRVAEGSLRSGWRTGATQFMADLKLRKGLNAFGSGLQALDLADDPRRADFLVTQLSGTVSRRFATQWSWRFDLFAQFSDHVLPDGERFKIGGDRLGRGFEVAEIAGDRGLGGKLELRRSLPGSEGPFGRLSAYGFHDFGAAWKRNLSGRESASTAGTGISMQGAHLTGYLEIAAPLTGTDVEGKRDPSVFAELSYRF